MCMRMYTQRSVWRGTQRRWPPKRVSTRCEGAVVLRRVYPSSPYFTRKPIPTNTHVLVPVSAMPAQSLATGSDVQRAKALYDYVAATNEEIDLEEGDLIIVEFKVWCDARAAGVSGMYILIHCTSPLVSFPSPAFLSRPTTAGGLEPIHGRACLACFPAALSRLLGARRVLSFLALPSTFLLLPF